jgi:hypothetical protein
VSTAAIVNIKETGNVLGRFIYERQVAALEVR